MALVAERNYFERALGAGVVQIWADLPRDVQEQLFEAAVFAGHVTERDESLREQLAEFLHDSHPRTATHKRPELSRD